MLVQALTRIGMLIPEELLAIRLGVERSSEGWPIVLEALKEIQYAGVAATHFHRWWARGLEIWWERLGADRPLAAGTIKERYEVISSAFEGLLPLSMPADSLGERPWRVCELTMEESGTFLPLDPSRAVRIRPRMPNPEWLDPSYAALGPAIKHAEDPRLDQSDLRRLRLLVRGA